MRAALPTPNLVDPRPTVSVSTMLHAAAILTMLVLLTPLPPCKGTGDGPNASPMETFAEIALTRERCRHEAALHMYASSC